MKEVILEAKSKEEAIKKAEESLNASESELVYSITEEKGKLFKGTTYKIKATTLFEVVEDALNFVSQVSTNLVGKTECTKELINRQLIIRLNSDKNAILIGKNGQTLKSIEILTRQYIYNKYNYKLNISLDVEDYKERKIANLERLARKTAKEVSKTKIEVSLENMNSYERRIVHNALTNFKGITTISEGEEPNRHVIIKPIEK